MYIHTHVYVSKAALTFRFVAKVNNSLRTAAD